ncbi:hypothetical protein HAX54_030740 [Datura stramonium]|uniref:Uncharacterized protein n=1 Tax=Datura stramonium TaxID=4076 RepID=A0ABS8V8F8_DATST|nr:hypothetical protein [Datura stramonium]
MSRFLTHPPMNVMNPPPLSKILFLLFPLKGKTDSSVSFDLDDMQNFWGIFEKEKFIAFKDRPFAHGRVICLEQLEESYFSVSLDEGKSFVADDGPSSVKLDEAQGAAIHSLSEAQEIKRSLGAVVGNLHKGIELLGKLSADMTSLQAQISLIQKEG